MGRDSTEVRMRRGSEFQPRRSTVGRLDAARRRRGRRARRSIARSREANARPRSMN